MQKKAQQIAKTLKQFFIVLTATASILLSLMLPVVAQQPVPSSPQPAPSSQQSAPGQPAIAAASTPADAGTPSKGADGSKATDQAPAPKRIFPLPGAEKYGGVPAPTSGRAEVQFQELIWGIIQNTRFILGAVAIAMIVYAGFQMVIGWGNEDVYGKQRKTLFYAVIGLAVVGMAGEVSRIFSVSCAEPLPGQPVIPCTPGGFLKDPNALIRTTTLFNQHTKMIITFIKYFIGGVAVLMIVRNGMRMITLGYAEDKIGLDKKNLVYSIIGLGLIIIADTVINKVFYKLDLTRYPSTGGAQPAIDAARGVQEIIGFTNFIVSLVGPVAILALLAGGVLYMTAGGQEDKMGRAKRVIIAALAGIIIIYGAFGIVSTFIVGRFPSPPAV